jgi:hypothetical protein
VEAPAGYHFRFEAPPSDRPATSLSFQRLKPGMRLCQRREFVIVNSIRNEKPNGHRFLSEK